MKTTVATVLMAALVAALLASPPAAAPADVRPNILFIVADDQSPFDLACYEPAAPLHTPVLDRLAAEGMVLDAAYHMGSFVGAVCVPSRHMLMTGRSLWHLRIGPKSRPAAIRCPDDIADWTIPAVLGRAGYDTMRTCKAENCYEDASRRFTVRHDATKRAGTADGGSAWHADRVLDFLADRERTGDREPFFVFLGFSHPHDTRDGTPDLLARYGAVNHTDRESLPPASDRQPPLPVNWLPSHPFPFNRPGLRDETQVSGVWDRRDPVTIRNEKGRECACAENIDIQIGRVLERLAALGELENTWIFYTSDHGIAVGRHGLMGKQNLYEHCWRVPLIVRGPGVKPGARAPGNVYLLDVLATLCEIAGIEPPATNEGRSFVPVLHGRVPAIRDVLYGVYSGDGAPGLRAVRRGDWKLVEIEMPALGIRRTQLFDLRDNPHELLAEHDTPAVRRASAAAPTPAQRNLAADPRHADTLAAMRRLLAEQMRIHDDPDRFADLVTPGSGAVDGDSLRSR